MINKVSRDILVVIILILVMLLVTTLTRLDRQRDPFAQVSHLSVRYSRNSAELMINYNVPINASKLFVCGVLDSTVSEGLQIILSHEEGSYMGRNSRKEIIEPGFFCSQIIVENRLTRGRYRISIIEDHDVIAELSLEIINQSGN